MKKKVRQIIALGLAGAIFLPTLSVHAAIEPSCLPLLTYADHVVNTYDEPGGEKKGFIGAKGSLVRVEQIRPDGWAYGSYALAGGRRKHRWFRMQDLQGYVDFQNYVITMNADNVVFRTNAQNTRLGTILIGSEALVVGENGNNLKILYRVSGQSEYKMGWIPAPVYDEYSDDEYYDDGYSDDYGYGGDNSGRRITIINNGGTISAGSVDFSENTDNSYNDNSTNTSIHDESYTDNSTNINKTRIDNSRHSTTTNVDAAVNVNQAANEPDNAMPSNARAFKGHHYYIYNVTLGWEEAKKFCEQRGGHLATVASGPQQQFLNQLLSKGGKANYWVGGYRNNNQWHWTTGASFKYSNWNSGEPNNLGDPGAHIAVNRNGKWSDVPAAEVNSDFGILCEWDY